MADGSEFLSWSAKILRSCGNLFQIFGAVLIKARPIVSVLQKGISRRRPFEEDLKLLVGIEIRSKSFKYEGLQFTKGLVVSNDNL